MQENIYHSPKSHQEEPCCFIEIGMKIILIAQLQSEILFYRLNVKVRIFRFHKDCYENPFLL